MDTDLFLVFLQAVVSLGLFLLFWLVGAAVFARLESWSFWIAFYFCFVSFSSIGYGDYSPATQGGRAFFCVWALMGAGAFSFLLFSLPPSPFLCFACPLRSH
jgi:hypothetical protein